MLKYKIIQNDNIKKNNKYYDSQCENIKLF